MYGTHVSSWPGMSCAAAMTKIRRPSLPSSAQALQVGLHAHVATSSSFCRQNSWGMPCAVAPHAHVFQKYNGMDIRPVYSVKTSSQK